MKNKPNDDRSFHPVSYGTEGITVREWLAGLAMQGLRTGDDISSSDKIAHFAVQDADALITELEKETK